MKNLLLITGILAYGTGARADQGSLAELTTFIEGNFDSSEQSLYEPDYFDVTVKYCRADVQNLPAGDSAQYLILEQAISQNQERPYRLRLVKIEESGPKFIVSNYEIADSQSLIGACSRETALQIDYAAFVDAKCTLELRKQGGSYVGGTPGLGCASNHNGATFVSSEIEINAAGFTSWDKGLDAAGEQIWGAERGPYRFSRIDIAEQTPALIELASNFLGHSSNELQAEEDSSFVQVDYKICPVKVSTAKGQPKRMYLVEHIINTPRGEIFRNRFYDLEKGPGADIIFRSLEFKEGQSLRGFCESDRPASEVIASSVIDQNTSCEMNFQPAAMVTGEAGFIGLTQIGGCPSSFQGSKSLTITGHIRPQSFNIWERWWSEDNMVVAGSKSGPYRYIRKKPFIYSGY